MCILNKWEIMEEERDLAAHEKSLSCQQRTNSNHPSHPRPMERRTMRTFKKAKYCNFRILQRNAFTIDSPRPIVLHTIRAWLGYSKRQVDANWMRNGLGGYGEEYRACSSERVVKKLEVVGNQDLRQGTGEWWGSVKHARACTPVFGFPSDGPDLQG